MKKPYSRLEKVEEQRQVRTAIKFVVLTIGLILFLVALGVPLLARLTGIATSLEGNQSIIGSEDKTPPAPPRISTLPSWTNEKDLVVEGNTEAGATVKVSINNESQETTADALGNFSVRIELVKGENTLYANATDNSNNESQNSQKHTVNYDNEPPKVEISKPTDGQTFAGSKEKQINIEGMTEAQAQVTINDRFLIVSGEGKFNYPTNLGDGENTFNVKSTDRAGNMTEVSLRVTYLP